MKTFADNTHEAILDSIQKFFKHGINTEVIVVFKIDRNGVENYEYKHVDCGGCWFEDNGFFVNGLKSYSKTESDGSQKHGYIIFETWRVLGAIQQINQDIENIRNDLKYKCEHRDIDV